MMIAVARGTAGALLLTLYAGTATAQTARPKAFVTISAAAQAAAAEMSDRVEFEANAEIGSVDSRYPARTTALLDGGIGLRFWRQVGAAVAVSHAAASGRSAVTARIPHPFFDDRHRVVEGEAHGISRTETAAHLQLFYEVPTTSRWRARLFAGPSYISLDQDLVREVTADESFPFDTATFDSALTSRAKGSGIGFNAGADLSWMFAKRMGAGLLVRYARARVDLNAPDSRTVSSDAGGVQAGAGLRFAF